MTDNMNDMSEGSVRKHLQDHIDAQDAKIAALEADRDGWRRAVGHLLSAVPVSEIVGVGGSIRDLAEWMKARHRDTKTIKALVDALERAVHNVPEFYTTWHVDARAALSAAKETT